MKNLIEYIVHILRAAQKESGETIPDKNDWVLILPRTYSMNVNLPDEILGFKVFVVEALVGAGRCIEFDLAMSKRDYVFFKNERIMKCIYRLQYEQTFSDDWSAPNDAN